MRNVEVVRSLYGASQRRDIPAILALLSPASNGASQKTHTTLQAEFAAVTTGFSNGPASATKLKKLWRSNSSIPMQPGKHSEAESREFVNCRIGELVIGCLAIRPDRRARAQ